MNSLRPTTLILLAGLLAGALDIVYACTFWAIKAGVSPQRILQSVAAGLLGKASYSGGWGTASLGLLLHFAIAVAMALAYFVVASQWRLLVLKPWLCGALYGLMLYVLMTYIVVPLSAAGPPSKDVTWIALSVAAHVLLVGIPIALISRRALSAETSQ
jgi:uncharacterized membrane protein YagU involved in acid resistance